MLEHRFFHNPDYVDYIRLLFDLHVALAEGWDETDDGEALRERMERPGSGLSSDEIASLSGISADFYSLTDQPSSDVSPVTADVFADLEPILQSWKSTVQHSPHLVLKAFDILFQQTRTEVADQTHQKLKSYIPVIQNSVFRLKTSGEAGIEADLLGEVFGHIDYCQHHSV
jgi:hypothetical protein